jgi:hypothetical protein
MVDGGWKAALTPALSHPMGEGVCRTRQGVSLSRPTGEGEGEGEGFRD